LQGSVSIGGILSANGGGYPKDQGPCLAPTNGGGGGHAGCGGNGGSSCNSQEYGNAFAPVTWGSGGNTEENWAGAGAPGGGAIFISVGRDLSITGTVSADGLVGQQDCRNYNSVSGG
jgi:hypothetical protein